MDYDTLRQDFPETISMEQFYKMAHISKRKAKWLLENGIVPCEDNGKRTRRFQIRLADAIAFLDRQAAGALEGVIPVGAFSGGASRNVPIREYLDGEELKAFLLERWQDEPDMLPTNRAATLCGYTTSTLNRWAAEGRVPSVRYFGSLLYSKEGLAAFLSSPYGQSIAVPSMLHKELMVAFSAEIKNSGMTFGVMSL